MQCFVNMLFVLVPQWMLYTNIQRIVGMDTIKGKINTRTTTRRDTRLSVDQDATANNSDSLLFISPSQLHWGAGPPLVTH